MPCVSSGHVLSETAGAHDPFVGSRLISSRHPAGPKGACIDGEDRVFTERLLAVRCFGSNLLSGGGLQSPAPGTGASRCGALHLSAARHVQ